jgi:hypothetical protein
MVSGPQGLEYELRLDAIDHGLDAALPTYPEDPSQIGEFGQGEPSSAEALRVVVRIMGRPVRLRSATIA